MTEKSGRVAGKAALVTGAASGIGAATARLLAREGAAVMLTDVDPRGEDVAREIAREGGTAHFLEQDVTDEDRWIEIVAATEKTLGELNVLVSNAGVGLGAPVTEMTLRDWRRQMAINVDGVFLSAKHSVPALRRAGGGAIVITSSVAGLRGAVGLSGYSATKGAVRLFGKSLALELAGDGIRVNTVHPGIIDTPIWGKIPTAAETSRTNAAIDPHALSAASTPLGRAGTADEIAQAIMWLASDASSYVSGSELVIDGAMTAGAFRRP